MKSLLFTRRLADESWSGLRRFGLTWANYRQRVVWGKVGLGIRSCAMGVLGRGQESVPKEKIHTCEYFLISLNVERKERRDFKKKSQGLNIKKGARLFIIIFHV